jgi:hypothetical protein
VSRGTTSGARIALRAKRLTTPAPIIPTAPCRRRPISLEGERGAMRAASGVDTPTPQQAAAALADETGEPV